MTQLVLTGLSQPWVIELRSGSNRLGRNPTNDFRLSDLSVSSFHCELIVSAGTALVRDLGSTNGTFINGELVKEATLKPGQILRLGAAELRLETQLPSVSIPPLSLPQSVRQTYLPDGSPACLNHPGRLATYQCSHCEHFFCQDCIRILGLAGGKSMIFCPSCNARCESLIEEPVIESEGEAPKKPSLFGRFTQRLKLPFKH